MNFQHPSDCPHCSAGCDHPHDPEDPIGVEVMIGMPVPAVAGSRMRRGGSFTDPKSGLTIGSDRWQRVRCEFCGSEAMTPVEVIPMFPIPVQAPDGAILSSCGACVSDMADGHRPGHNRHRRRRRHPSAK